MSLYVTELGLKKPSHQIEKVKDKFINYIIQEESQHVNLDLIEQQLQMSSKTLKEKIDKTNIVIKAKQAEIDGFTSQINATVKELYQFNLGVFSGINLDEIIKEKRDLIRVREHEYSVYCHMKTRLYNTNRSIQSRIDSEQAFQKKTQDQAFSYKIMHNKASKDYGQQNQMLLSLSQKNQENEAGYSSEIVKKNKLHDKEQENLKLQKNAYQNQIKYHSHLQNEQRLLNQLIKKRIRCNVNQYNDIKAIRREYKQKRVNLYMISYVLSVKQLNSIIEKVNDGKKRHNEMFQEYLYLNSDINRYSDQTARFESTLSGMKTGINAKEKEEVMLSTEYSDVIIQIKESKIKRMQFINKQFDMQRITKEALILKLITFVSHKVKVFNEFDRSNDNAPAFPLLSNVGDYEMSNYPACLIQFCRIFNAASCNYFIQSYSLLQSFASSASSSRKFVISLQDDLPSSQNYLRKSIPSQKDSTGAAQAQVRQLNPSLISTNLKSKGSNFQRKTHSELMVDFKTYLKHHKDNIVYNYVTKFPKKSLNNLSKYYSEASNDLTSASSRPNINSPTSRFNGFHMRMTYDLFKARKNSNSNLLYNREYLSNRSGEHELNEDSYELSSNPFQLSQPLRECYSCKVKFPKEDSDQKRIKARMADLYKMEVKSNDKLTLKNTQELMEAYFQYETKKKNRKYHLQSAYSMRNLMSSKGFNRDLLTPRPSSNRYQLDFSTRIVNTNYKTHRATSEGTKGNWSTKAKRKPHSELQLQPNHPSLLKALQQHRSPQEKIKRSSKGFFY